MILDGIISRMEKHLEKLQIETKNQQDVVDELMKDEPQEKKDLIVELRKLVMCDVVECSVKLKIEDIKIANEREIKERQAFNSFKKFN